MVKKKSQVARKQKRKLTVAFGAGGGADSVDFAPLDAKIGRTARMIFYRARSPKAGLLRARGWSTGIVNRPSQVQPSYRVSAETRSTTNPG